MEATAAGRRALGIATDLRAVTREMAAVLLAAPDDGVIEVWNDGNHWGWGGAGESNPPVGADLVVQDRVFNGDATRSIDTAQIERYARELSSWLRTMSE